MSVDGDSPTSPRLSRKQLLIISLALVFFVPIAVGLALDVRWGDRDMRIGIVLGFALVAVALWIHSLALSANLAGVLPSFSEMLNGLLVFGPVFLFVGFTVMLHSWSRRIVMSLVLALIITVIVAWLIFWG